MFFVFRSLCSQKNKNFYNVFLTSIRNIYDAIVKRKHFSDLLSYWRALGVVLFRSDFLEELPQDLENKTIKATSLCCFVVEFYEAR